MFKYNNLNQTPSETTKHAIVGRESRPLVVCQQSLLLYLQRNYIVGRENCPPVVCHQSLSLYLQTHFIFTFVLSVLSKATKE